MQHEDGGEQHDRVPRPGVLKPHWMSSKALRKNAAPKSMPAVTATWPRKLNHPVNQHHAAALCGASLADQ